MDDSPKVFIVKDNPNLDYTHAEEYGDVVFVSNSDFSPTNASPHNGAIVEGVKTVMQSFRPEIDKLVLTGSPMLIALVGHLALERAGKRGTITVLRWSGIERRYFPFTVST
jgi:hypothetical protein